MGNAGEANPRFRTPPPDSPTVSVGYPACRPLRISLFLLGHVNAARVRCASMRAGRGPGRRGRRPTGESGIGIAWTRKERFMLRSSRLLTGCVAFLAVGSVSPAGRGAAGAGRTLEDPPAVN